MLFNDSPRTHLLRSNSQSPPLLWITLPSPGCMLSCPDKLLRFFFSWLCGPNFVVYFFLLRMKCNQVTQFRGWAAGKFLPTTLYCTVSSSSLTYYLLSHCLSWCPALSPFHSGDRWWQSCHLPWAACCGSRWAQYPTSHPGQRESAVRRMKCSWSSRQALWVHTPTHKNKHINRGVCISLSLNSLCSLMMYFFLVNSSDNRSGLDLS